MGLSPAGLRTALRGLWLMETQSKEGGVRCEGHIIEGGDPISLLKQALPVRFQCHRSRRVLPIQMIVQDLNSFLVHCGLELTGKERGPR